MNHLAHLFLAPDSELHRVGSLMGDFAKWVDRDELPSDVREGLLHHLAVDTFTDQHPEVIASKQLFSKQRRRFAGVALDILYDHFLLRHWDRFSDVSQEEFIGQVYRELRRHRKHMPEPMQKVTGRIVRYDWFRSYRRLDNIGFAIDRVANRVRFTHSFHGIIEEICDHESALEEHFLAFFPDLQGHADSVFR
ncbi:ACP phosphodiesterase [Marinobacter sp. CHS3-4]|uniref:acyl carrier protein phosphodiesterase n=1 Tax=Marinobacter sp. CHS3-4 TaxID=3045174 RepID=UPI0024B4D935|nr:ACP phosphodiesterase [Marinobacter sp. CHS3-4]MDI9245396.1 ACP phosphodiesterase [Marinobacter sp. CHS3-4]